MHTLWVLKADLFVAICLVHSFGLAVKDDLL
jgi:hypothetical protein